MKTVKGEISIGRYHGSGVGEESVYISIEDDAAGCMIVEVLMTPHEFAQVLTGSGNRPGTVKVYTDAPIGMIREHKTELVPSLDYSKRDNNKAINAVLKPFEVDGWKARKEDLFNHHMKRGNQSQVSFVRHVNAPESTT